MEKYKQLVNLVASMEEDVNKFYNKGNSQAAIRVRSALQEIKQLSQDIRFEISSIKKSAPPKKRKKKEENDINLNQ